MKNLNLAAYGVAEMNRDEMKATEGGIVGLILLGIAATIVYAVPFICQAVENYELQQRRDSWGRNEAAKWNY
jgi:hypothetical protein